MADLSALVLAGGASRRMGRDKRRLIVDGVPLLRRAIEAVAAVTDDVVVVESHHSRVPRELLPSGVRLVCDRRVGAGPLAGLEAGLDAARGAIVLAVAGDAPWLEPPLLRFLAETLDGSTGAEAAAVIGARGPEPLLAAYRHSVGPVVTRLLDVGERRLGVLLTSVSLLVVGERVRRRFDPGARSAVNVNTPDDLCEAGVAGHTRSTSELADLLRRWGAEFQRVGDHVEGPAQVPLANGCPMSPLDSCAARDVAAGSRLTSEERSMVVTGLRGVYCVPQPQQCCSQQQSSHRRGMLVLLP